MIQLIKDIWWLIRKRGKGAIKISENWFPDRVVFVGRWHDKLLVVCEHSVWELDRDYQGLIMFRLLCQP